VKQIRALEEKESQKLTAALGSEVYALAAKEAGNDPEKLAAAYERIMVGKVKQMPWGVVGDDIQQRRAAVQMMSEALVAGQVKAALDPVVEKTQGEISADVAEGLIAIHTQLTRLIPVKDAAAAALTAAIDANRVEKKDIWQERDVALPAGGALAPVLVAVWDSGVDVRLYKDQLWANAKEQTNGKDDDGNGFVDDLNGIAFDLDANRVVELLHPIDALSRDVGEVTRHMKGFLDMQAAIDSPESEAVKKFVAGLKPDEVKTFFEDMGLFGNYSHGTHVAGIALTDNPYARLLTVRLTFDWKMIPRAPTIELAKREAQMYADTVAYLKQAGARVVNMSWGGSRESIERELEANGVGASAEERAQLAREIFKIGYDGLLAAIRSAPEILFVCAAGNADNDVLFSEMMPAGMDAPNLLVVGAVDQAGDPTNFTSFGKTVKVYASGFEVDSFIPGGQKLKFSGTSMASPNVVNLVAKLLAQNPELTPAELIDLVQRGADDHKSGDKTLKLINPKKTMALVKK
jgi:subtilisin family serine protease